MSVTNKEAAPNKKKEEAEEATAPPRRLLTVSILYVQVWAVANVGEWFYGTLGRHSPYDATQFLLCVVCLMFPRKRRVRAIAFLARAFGLLARLPLAWDSEWFAALTDLNVGLCEVFDVNDSVIGVATTTQVGVFYAAAGLWKLNSGFLEPRTSCASTYGLQLVDAYVGADSYPTLASFVFRFMPSATVAVELSVGFLFLFGAYFTSKTMTKAAISLGLLLHLGIALTPPPNNIAAFGTVCAVRYLWAIKNFPDARTATKPEWPTLLALAGAGAAGLAGLAKRYHVAAPSIQTDFVSSVDWAAAVYGGVAAIVGYLALRGGGGGVTHRREIVRRRTTKSPSQAVVVVFLAGSLMAFWCFVPIMFGILDGGSPNMFSNLALMGGSNHYLNLPTGLLQRWHAKKTGSVFAGGYVRVDATNSTLLDSSHPGDLSDVLRPGVKKALRAHDAPGLFWNPTVAHVIGTNVMPPNKRKHAYVVPAFELHRILSRETQTSPITLRYTPLPGVVGDENWRRFGGGKTIEVTFAPRRYPRVVRCDVVSTLTMKSGSPPPSQCDENDTDLFFLKFAHLDDTWLNRLGGWLQMWNSNVVLGPDDETTTLHCYGS